MRFEFDHPAASCALMLGGSRKSHTFSEAVGIPVSMFHQPQTRSETKQPCDATQRSLPLSIKTMTASVERVTARRALPHRGAVVASVAAQSACAGPVVAAPSGGEHESPMTAAANSNGQMTPQASRSSKKKKRNETKRTKRKERKGKEKEKKNVSLAETNR